MNQSDILCPHVSYFVWVAVKPQKIVAGSDVQLHYLRFLHILELFEASRYTTNTVGSEVSYLCSEVRCAHLICPQENRVGGGIQLAPMFVVSCNIWRLFVFDVKKNKEK